MLTRGECENILRERMQLGQYIKRLVREMYNVPGTRTCMVSDFDIRTLEEWLKDFLVALLRELEVSSMSAAEHVEIGTEVIKNMNSKLHQNAPEKYATQRMINVLIGIKGKVKEIEERDMIISDMLAICSERESRTGKSNEKKRIRNQISRFFSELSIALRVNEVMQISSLIRKVIL